MDIKQIRQILKENPTVVLVEEGKPPLIVRQWQEPAVEASEEVPIAARWPKTNSAVQFNGRQDSVLERLNREILALKEQIAQEEAQETSTEVGQNN